MMDEQGKGIVRRSKPEKGDSMGKYGIMAGGERSQLLFFHLEKHLKTGGKCG
ncbi:MAG: hypothetical protein HQL48_07925 [Gammaproteobacteria bacterium]|nr:hypothetical protein [Gammaproteobacteria bacterium]